MIRQSGKQEDACVANLFYLTSGSYTVQIWWKGDPGVENFMIKFQNEEMMKKWASGLDQQRKENVPQPAQAPDQVPPNFAWMQSQSSGLENPYAQQDDEDEEDSYGPVNTMSQYGSQQPPQQVMPGTMTRNASSTSLRSRAGTSEGPQSLAGIARAPPPRFPLPQPPAPLSVQTQVGGAPVQPSPNPQPPNPNSYFSPTLESPASSRTSTTSGFFPNNTYSYQPPATQPPVWEDNNRYTAPAMPHAQARDSQSPANAYARNPRGPSLPVMASQTSQQLQQQRSRSYSTPNIDQPVNGRRQNGQSVPAVPGIPQHLHPAHERHDSNIPRSNTGSPRNELPVRTNTQSPGTQRERERSYGAPTMTKFPSHPIYPRSGSVSGASVAAPPAMPPSDPSRTMSPPLANSAQNSPNPATPSEADMLLPTQLKVKVNCDTGNYVTLVVAFNITYQSLIDRIDAKLNRFTSSSIGKGNLKLRYQDEDGDFVTIESDDDIQIAISEWREGMRNTALSPAGVGEIELFCVGEMN